MSTPSIRRSLLIRCGIGVGTLLCLLSAWTYLLVRQRLYHELDVAIKETAALLANQVELEDDRISFEWQEGIGTNRDLIPDGLFQFWENNTGATTRSPGLRFRDLPRFTGIGGEPLLRSITLSNGHRARAIGLRIFPFVTPEEKLRMIEKDEVIDPRTIPFTLVVARDGEPTYQTLELLRNILIIGTLLILGLGFVLIQRVVGSALLPINLLSRQVQNRSEHQLDAALDLPDELPIELKGLAETFDRLLARVAATRQREKDFIRHAAHELRTPIAGLRATTDLALSQQRDAAAYAEHLATCQKTAIELGELVKRLSALARLEQSNTTLVIESLDISRIVSSTVENFRSQFEQENLQLSYHGNDSLFSTRADQTLLQIVLNNLLDNARSYAKASSTVQVELTQREGRTEIRITNAVDDFPDDLERMFEPLFRRETSRHDAASHLGIGLTLSREAARTMGGNLTASRASETEIAFTLSLP